MSGFYPQPMAVEAPTLDSGDTIVASHAPKVALPSKVKVERDGSESEDDVPLGAGRAVVNGNGNAKGNGKRGGSSGSSSEDEKPLAKKPRMSNGAGATNRKRVVESDSDSDAGPSSPPVVVKNEVKVPKATAKPRASAASKPPPSDSDSSDDEKPLAKKRAPPSSKTNSASKANGSGNGTTKSKPKIKAETESESSLSSSGNSSEESSSEDEKPLAKIKKVPAAKPAPRKSGGSAASGKSGKKVKKEVKSESSEDDEVPLAKSKKVVANGKGKGKDVKPNVKVKREKKVKEEEDEEEKYKWWEAEANGDGSVKWTTFVHRGVLFPPPYVPLPKDVKMKYDGVSLTLPPESEEVAGFFAAMIETDHAQDAKFRENFFRDFKMTLEKYPPKESIKVKSLEKCDFRPMYEHFEREKDRKKAMSREEKKALKEAKDNLEKDYLYCLVDGRKEKLGNFRAEPPGLFRGRGEHPRKGTLKLRLRPEDIIINIGKDAPIPVPNVPGQWKAIQHDNTVTWVANWKENVNNQMKYVFLAAGSSWKGQSDRTKFEKARELIKHVDKIRKDYTADLKSKIMADRQRATALYFIDRLSLRAGNEKGEDEADTVGCCSLRYEHVTLEPPNKVIFDFLGKDSMRYHQVVEVDHQVFKNIKLFKAEPKQKGDDLFDRLNTTGLNKYLQDQMKGLTAKVFRTYNASWTFQQQLKNTPENGTVQEKILAYNTANREVAILCNHQKTVSKGFAESFQKQGDKIKALKYQRLKLRLQLFSLDPKIKKKRPDLAEDESDLDEEFMERHESELLEKALEAARKKFEKENAKAEEGGDGAPEKKSDKWLKERLGEIEEEFEELRRERKSRNVEPRKNVTDEKLLEQIQKMDERIAAAKVSMEDRDKTKDVALGTSKINYIDPRLTVAWSRKYNVPIEKMFSKTLREKFPWAEAEADADWVF